MLRTCGVFFVFVFFFFYVSSVLEALSFAAEESGCRVAVGNQSSVVVYLMHQPPSVTIRKNAEVPYKNYKNEDRG